jgi:hypothetical protein
MAERREGEAWLDKLGENAQAMQACPHPGGFPVPSSSRLLVFYFSCGVTLS